MPPRDARRGMFRLCGEADRLKDLPGLPARFLLRILLLLLALFVPFVLP